MAYLTVFMEYGTSTSQRSQYAGTVAIGMNFITFYLQCGMRIGCEGNWGNQRWEFDEQNVRKRGTMDYR